MRKTKKKSDAMRLLEKLAGGPLTLGRAMESVRKSEGLPLGLGGAGKAIVRRDEGAALRTIPDLNQRGPPCALHSRA